VLRRVETAYVPAPACLLGFAAWRIGQGALARAAVERALDADEDYRMAMLLQHVLGYGLSPAVADGWPAVDRLDLGGGPGPGARDVAAGSGSGGVRRGTGGGDLVPPFRPAAVRRDPRAHRRRKPRRRAG
jgi:hypothetical protein